MITIIKGNAKSALFLEKEKILVSSGENGTSLRKHKKNNLIKIFEEIKCIVNNGIANIGNGRIIVLSGTYFFVISIQEREIIKKLNIFNKCDLVHAVKTKNIFLFACENKIFIYRKDSFKFEETGITDNYTERRYRKIIGINNEKYIYLPSYSKDIYISKY